MSIVLQDLVKQFGSNTIVDRVSIEIADGELLVLLGPSGSGKSTILRLIAGLIPVDSGRIWLHGQDVTDLPPQQRNTGFVFQNYSLFRHMTVAGNIEFGLSVRKVPRQQREAKREELLALVGLAGLGGRLPRQLSGGQQQRVAVARALAFEPSVLLLDEPFGALDVKIREQLREVLKKIQRKVGITTILVTHDQEEAFELADRIGLVERGKLLEVGPPAALYRSPQQEFTATFLGGANLLAARHESGRISIGELRLADAVAPTTADPEGRLEILFRPEDLTLAASRADLDIPLLGQAVVEDVLFLGTLQRVRLRLQPLPGSWHLPMQYGETGVTIQVARMPQSDDLLDLRVGQTVWVGVRNFHVLPRVPIRLLVCAEQGADAESYFRFTGSLARATAGPVTVLAVAEEEAHVQPILEQAKQALTSQNVQFNSKSQRGHPVDQILREIKTGAYDMVLTPDQPQQANPLRGDNWSKLLARLSATPVLVVKGERAGIRRVLFCTAGGEPGKRDIVFGGRLARRAGAAATLLYVERGGRTQRTVSKASGDGRQEDHKDVPVWVERHLEDGVRTLTSQGIKTEIRVRRGQAVEEILAESASGDYDVIVIGAHLATRAAGLQPHDVTSEILTRADRPVLVVNDRPGVEPRS